MESSHTPVHNEKHTCASTFESLSVLILEARILSGCVNKTTLYIINVITNLLLIMKRNQVFDELNLIGGSPATLMVKDDGREATFFQVDPTQSRRWIALGRVNSLSSALVTRE